MSVHCEWDATLGVVVVENGGDRPLRAHFAVEDPAGEAPPRERFAAEIPTGETMAVKAPVGPSPRFDLKLYEGAKPIRPEDAPILTRRFDARLTLDLDAPYLDDGRIERRLSVVDPETGRMRSEFDASPLGGAAPRARFAAIRNRRLLEGKRPAAYSATLIDSAGARGPTLVADPTPAPRLGAAFGLLHRPARSPVRAEATLLLKHPAIEIDVTDLEQSDQRILEAVAFVRIAAPVGLARGARHLVDGRLQPRRPEEIAPEIIERIEAEEGGKTSARRLLRYAWLDAEQGDAIGVICAGVLKLERAERGEFDEWLAWRGPETASQDGAHALIGIFAGDAVIGLDAAQAPALSPAFERLKPLPVGPGVGADPLEWIALFLPREARDRTAEAAIPSLLWAYAEARARGAPGVDLERLAGFLHRPEAAVALTRAHPQAAARAARLWLPATAGFTAWCVALAADAKVVQWASGLDAVGQAVASRLALSGRGDALAVMADMNVAPDLEPEDVDAAMAALARAGEPTEQRAAGAVHADLGRLADWRRLEDQAARPGRGRPLSLLLELAEAIEDARAAVAQDLARADAALEAIGRSALGDPRDPNTAWRRLSTVGPTPDMAKLRARIAEESRDPALRRAADGIETRAVLQLLLDALQVDRRLGPVADHVYAWAERALTLENDVGWRELAAAITIDRAEIDAAVTRLSAAIHREHGDTPPPRFEPRDPQSAPARRYEDADRVAGDQALDWFRRAAAALGDPNATSSDLAQRTRRLIARIQALAPWLALRRGWALAVRRLAEAEAAAASDRDRRALARLRRRLSDPPARWPQIAREIAVLHAQLRPTAERRRA